MTKKNNYKSQSSSMIKSAVSTMVAVPLISATSGVVNEYHGVGDNLLRLTPGFQSLAVVGENIKPINKSFGLNNKIKTKSKGRFIK